MKKRSFSERLFELKYGRGVPGVLYTDIRKRTVIKRIDIKRNR